MQKEKGGHRDARGAEMPSFSWSVLPCLALVVVAACGGDGEQPPSTTPSALSARPVTASPTPSPAPVTAATPPPLIETPTAAPDPRETPAPEPAAIGLLTVVDKQRSLPADHVPPNLTPLGAAFLAPGFSGSLQAEAKAALERMLSAAYAEGHDLYARSAYRSYVEQERTFAYWVSVLGEEDARRVSAETGHSEHQLGTTADLTNADVGYDLTESFGETPGGRWLAANAHAFGFALSYPAGAEAVTGYAYEPWHFRYIGVEHAAAWKASGATLGEYLRGLEG